MKFPTSTHPNYLLYGILVAAAGAGVANFFFELPNWSLYALLASIFYAVAKITVEYLHTRREKMLEQPQMHTIDVIDFTAIIAGGVIVYAAARSL